MTRSRLWIWLFGSQGHEPTIKPPTYRFTGHNEGLAVRTRKRREAADAIRARANRVDSGARVGDVLRMVKK